MNKKTLLYFFIFFNLFCFKSVKLPEDFETKCSVWINLMPSPPPHIPSEKIKGVIEFKGSLKEEILLLEVYVYKGKEKIRVNFEKTGKNRYVLNNFPLLTPQEEIDFLIKFKYAGKAFEKEIKKIKVGVVY